MIVTCSFFVMQSCSRLTFRGDLYIPYFKLESLLISFSKCFNLNSIVEFAYFKSALTQSSANIASVKNIKYYFYASAFASNKRCAASFKPEPYAGLSGTSSSSSFDTSMMRMLAPLVLTSGDSM